jgi:hypothetical protein
MASGDLSASTSRDGVAEYLAAVTARLAGPPAARVAVADELRDGLLEALQAHQVQGAAPAEATAAVIAEFGDPGAVAAAFGPELGAVQARRVALGLVVTGPLVGLAWIAAGVVNALVPWPHQLIGPWLALPVVGLALVVAGPALGLTVATTGRLGRRLGRVVHRVTFFRSRTHSRVVIDAPVLGKDDAAASGARIEHRAQALGPESLDEPFDEGEVGAADQLPVGLR